jgi:hypothetical protein
MQPAARLSVIVFAIFAVFVVLVLWKKSDRSQAITELEERFGAQLSITADEFYLGCSSPELKDLTELAELVLRVGKPQILDLTGAPALTSLKGAERLPSLTSIVAIDCPALASAEGVSGLPGLTQLHFTDSTGLSDTSGCAALDEPRFNDLPSLENLYLSRCRGLKSLDVAAFPGLRQLYVDGCAGLSAIAGLERLTSLTDLDVSNATGLAGLPGVGALSGLIVLDIRNLDLADFSGIASLPKLRVLRMGGQDAVETLEPFTALATLTELHLEACPNLRSLRGMPPGISQYAGFTHCPKLVSLDGVESAGALEHLDVTGCVNLGDVAAAAKLANLVQVSFVKCRGVTAVPFVETLPNLRIVMLGGSGVVPAAIEGLKAANGEIIFDFAVAE